MIVIITIQVGVGVGISSQVRVGVGIRIREMGFGRYHIFDLQSHFTYSKAPQGLSFVQEEESQATDYRQSP